MEAVLVLSIVLLYIIIVVSLYGALQHTLLEIALKNEVVDWQSIQVISAFLSLCCPLVGSLLLVACTKKFEIRKGSNYKIFKVPYDDLALQEVDFSLLIDIWSRNKFGAKTEIYWRKL